VAFWLITLRYFMLRYFLQQSRLWPLLLLLLLLVLHGALVLAAAAHPC
jgi:uncharacterized integral membrane protein